ncbi:hypothetical protein [Reyranella soli]|jgi:hypothetical protein|uniref:STAS/SEC14 domain-containing protein n=1 Tax=Reyranella soli TaxID=1230389 RepID=A0A512N1R2_9HYPH|nr:hypothetical protein [Reyranella soli]GEP52919.1 hypothetical protein RSO01_00850 [Reyranella soli]
MPMRWTISHDERLVLATAEGPLGLLEIEAYFDALIVAGAQPYAKLFDGRSMDVRLTDDDVMAVGARMSAYVKDQQWTGGPAAFVVTTRANREFVKRFINLTASPRQAKIFQTLDEARAWLDEQKS